ncbi:hypothetical protein CEK28_04685 [Xenophilus sp. AP218F]|nr:hypothetical protein CEK28_04685 [Xenophilus sp. AP218F]
MSRELEIIEKIVLGLDPMRVGATLDTPRDPGLDKARAVYYEHLKRVCKQHVRPERLPASEPDRHPAPRKGERWTIAEDNRLEALWDTSPAITTEQLAVKLGRTRSAIISRLSKLGLFPDHQQAMLADNRRLEAAGSPPFWQLDAAPASTAAAQAVGEGNAGRRWTEEDDGKLRRDWRGADAPSCGELALRLGRTRGAIIARLVRIGEFPDRDAAIAADRLRREK